MRSSQPVSHRGGATRLTHTIADTTSLVLRSSPSSPAGDGRSHKHQQTTVCNFACSHTYARRCMMIEGNAETIIVASTWRDGRCYGNLHPCEFVGAWIWNTTRGPFRSKTVRQHKLWGSERDTASPSSALLGAAGVAPIHQLPVSSTRAIGEINEPRLLPPSWDGRVYWCPPLRTVRNSLPHYIE